MKRVGILGGTFDPIHIGHTALAKSALEQFNLTEVRLMTGGMPPHKRDKKITPAPMRAEMVHLATEDEENLVADDFEISKREYTYTANILTELKCLHDDWDIHFIIGEDSLADFGKWYKPEKVLSKCVLLVYPRSNNSELERLIDLRRAEYGGDIRRICAPCIDISSTHIRQMVAEDRSVDEYVHPKVAQYIKRKGLYR